MQIYLNKFCAKSMGQGGSQIIHKAFIEFSDTVFNEEISQVAENHLRDDPHVTEYGDKN